MRMDNVIFDRSRQTSEPPRSTQKSTEMNIMQRGGGDIKKERRGRGQGPAGFKGAKSKGQEEDRKIHI